MIKYLKFLEIIEHPQTSACHFECPQQNHKNQQPNNIHIVIFLKIVDLSQTHISVISFCSMRKNVYFSSNPNFKLRLRSVFHNRWKIFIKFKSSK